MFYISLTVTYQLILTPAKVSVNILNKRTQLLMRKPFTLARRRNKLRLNYACYLLTQQIAVEVLRIPSITNVRQIKGNNAPPQSLNYFQRENKSKTK